MGEFTENKKFREWLGGLSLSERMRELESGKLERCVKCNKIFFDRESPEERQSFRCKPSSADHECIEYENYIVLSRCFRGIHWIVNFPDSVTPSSAIIEFFSRQRQSRKEKERWPSGSLN